MDFMTILSNILGELFAPTTAAYALAAIGLNIHFGMSGLMNMGQAGFMLLGAYGFAITQMNGCDLFTSVLTALVLAAIYGILLGIPTLKLGPDYLAMVTLAAAPSAHPTTRIWRCLFSCGSDIGMHLLRFGFARRPAAAQGLKVS